MEKHRNLSLDSREYRNIGRNITSSVNRDSFTPLTLTLIVTPTRHIYTYIYIFYTYIHISIFIHTIIHIHFHLIFSFNNLINLRPAKQINSRITFLFSGIVLGLYLLKEG